MSTIIRATVISNSSSDDHCRVKLKSEGLWSESPLVESVNAIPLHTGDVVYVDISNGVEAPLIIGKASTKQSRPSTIINGSVLFDSSNGSQWTVAFVKNDKFEIVNSSGSSIVINGANVTVNATNVSLNSNLESHGSVIPTGEGPFCAIKVCPYNGQPHVGSQVIR